nr:hypothetical protein [uncultured Hyphomonas sp.]
MAQFVQDTHIHIETTTNIQASKPIGQILAHPTAPGIMSGLTQADPTQIMGTSPILCGQNNIQEMFEGQVFSQFYCQAPGAAEAECKADLKPPFPSPKESRPPSDGALWPTMGFRA